VIRAQIIGLELILAILEKPKSSFLQRKEFLHIIKNHLCDGLLRYSVSNEREIFSLVASIFFYLFTHFRKYLKSIILVFVETIFLQLLASSNTSYHHKHLILTVFDKLSQNSMMLLEIFINYDCDVGQQDISKQIVEALSKIANGKLARSEHKSMISSQEELVLRSYSI
jgi:brefeldin A-inhibited guanine nucleotide-exchange protein